MLWLDRYILFCAVLLSSLRYFFKNTFNSFLQNSREDLMKCVNDLYVRRGYISEIETAKTRIYITKLIHGWLNQV